MNRLVAPHNPNWKAAFQTEAKAISTALAPDEITLHHIGSTAIAGILAKPIIDLLGVVPAFEFLDAQTAKMEALGYEVMGPFGIEARRYFRKVDTSGQRTHHLHVFKTESPHIERHLAFRDYLQQHAHIAREYSDLKAALTSGTTPSWDAYIEGKDPFIARVEKQALRWYRLNRPQ